jgi:hypothetical protein
VWDDGKSAPIQVPTVRDDLIRAKCRFNASEVNPTSTNILRAHEALREEILKII